MNNNYIDYIKKNLDPMIKEFYVKVLENKPDDVLNFLQNYLNNYNPKKNLKNQDSYDSYSEDESDIDIKQIHLNKKNLINKKKKSISAEVYGEYNKIEEFKARFIEKSSEVQEKIRKKLNQAFMFSNLDENEQNIVIGAMEIFNYNENEYIIKQGDDGDILYLIEEGKLDCYKKFNKNEADTYLKTYFHGESFGELALLYNVPRAASIISKTKCVLYGLDRATFNNIVKMSAIKKRNMFEEFLESVEILKTLNNGEINKISDCLRIQKFKKGEFIIKEGEIGNSFFIVKEGNLQALKKDENGNEMIVFEYGPKSYFGELSLLKKQKRAASIIVVSEISEIIELDKQAFNNLLGPLEEILKRNIEMYSKFVPKLYSNRDL